MPAGTYSALCKGDGNQCRQQFLKSGFSARTHLTTQVCKICHNYSKCHVTSNKANSNLECAEDKFQTRGLVQGFEK
jgi:hypothetical protein